MATGITRRAVGAVAGFTLVEMMIALTIGLLLSLVVAQLFANTRATSRATDDSARMQENARYATAVIGRVVRMTGYMSDPRGNATLIFPAATPALEGTDGVYPVNDTLTVRYQGTGTANNVSDGTVLDCLGQPVKADYTNAAVTSYNRFSIAPGQDGRTALWCSSDPADLIAGNSGTELVSGVDAMQVLFGVDTTPTPDGSADLFLSPGAVGAATNAVVVVRVYLLLSGSENAAAGVRTVQYHVGGQTITFTDQKIRRVVTTTIALRNRAP